MAGDSSFCLGSSRPVARHEPPTAEAIDAGLLALVAERVRPEARPLPDAATQALDGLPMRGWQLIEMLTAERNRLGFARPPVRRDIARHMRWLEHQLDDVRSPGPAHRAESRLVRTGQPGAERTGRRASRQSSPPGRAAGARRAQSEGDRRARRCSRAGARSVPVLGKRVVNDLRISGGRQTAPIRILRCTPGRRSGAARLHGSARQQHALVRPLALAVVAGTVRKGSQPPPALAVLQPPGRTRLECRQRTQRLRAALATHEPASCMRWLAGGAETLPARATYIG